MIQRIINRILRPRHFWRNASFDELSELYVTQFLRSLSISLVGMFLPVYLYKIGYSITQIAIFYLIWFGIRPVLAYLTARVIAEIGPKHAMVLSVALQIVFLGFVMSLQSAGWPLWFLAILGSAYYGMYRMAFDIDFSKVKHNEHGGKEVGYLQIFERLGGVIGPLFGGLIAGFFDPRYTIALAILLLVFSLVPLLMTAESVKKHQLIVIKGFPWRRVRVGVLLSGAYHVQEVIVCIIWPLFLGVFIITNHTYQFLGLLSSISTILAIVTAYFIGKFIDNNNARKLFNFGVITTVLTSLFAPFVGSALNAAIVNIVREPLMAMYRIPFMRGRYDEADHVPGYRITYFMYIEFAIAAANIFLWGSVVIISSNFADKFAIQFALAVGALIGMILIKQQFSTLRT